MEQKRQCPRYNLEKKSLVHIDNTKIKCVTNDVSETGVSFVLPPEIDVPIGSIIKFELLSFFNFKETEGEVVRIMRDRNQTIIGCQIIGENNLIGEVPKEDMN